MTDETVAQEEQPEVEETPIANPDNAEPESNDAEQPEADQEEKPEGWDPVDFYKDDPAKIEKRFNRLYGQVKRGETLMKQMADDNRRLMERFENWETGQVQQRNSQRITELERDFKDAVASGDADRQWTITRELTELHAQATQPVRKAEPQQPKKQGGLPDDETAVIADWASRRPFAHDGHADQKWTADELNALYADPQWASKPIEDKLEEIDRRYTQKSRPRTSQVLDGQGGNPGTRNRGPKLSEEQKGVARFLFPGIPAKDAYAKYAAGMGKTQ